MPTSSAEEIVVHLRSGGLRLVLTTERAIRVTPASSLTPELREVIRGNKDSLVDWLSKEAANDGWNVYIPPGTSPATIAKFRAASVALDASQAYYDHHFKCPTCIAAGKGEIYGQRCELGTALLQRYNGTP